jgi:hypothetical protein
MNAFELSKQSKEMQGSAWCIKQHKVFRVFHYTGIPNRIPLELWKRSSFSEGKKRKRKGNARILASKEKKKFNCKNSGRYMLGLCFFVLYADLLGPTQMYTSSWSSWMAIWIKSWRLGVLESNIDLEQVKMS